MSGGIPPIPLYAFVSCIGATLPLSLYIKEKGLNSVDCIHLVRDGGSGGLCIGFIWLWKGLVAGCFEHGYITSAFVQGEI
jgi:hypothetical protein